MSERDAIVSWWGNDSRAVDRLRLSRLGAEGEIPAELADRMLRAGVPLRARSQGDGSVVYSCSMRLVSYMAEIGAGGSRSRSRPRRARRPAGGEGTVRR